MKKLLILLLFLPCLIKAQNNNLHYTYIEFMKDSTSVFPNEITTLTVDTTGDFDISTFCNTQGAAYRVNYTPINGVSWDLWNAAAIPHIKSNLSPMTLYLNKGDVFTIYTKAIGVHWRLQGRFNGP